MAEGVLGEIVARKRADVAARLGDRSLEQMRALAVGTRRSLGAALRRPGARFIMEVKKASPSAGAIAAVDPAAQARAYRGAADAISVLTDTPYFGGSLDDLAAVRAVFDGPLLAKDFVIDRRQVVEARLHGADAILVMLSVLDDEAARAMIEEAEMLGMEALVEVHDEAELTRAIALGAPIIGINNRDLKTLTVDLAVTERLAPLVPADRLVVSESGIRAREDVARLAAHADAFLVGTALMSAPRPAEAARALVYGRVKVCGLTNRADLAAAEAAGASHAGLIFVPGTPRALSVDEAEQMLAQAGENMGRVGIFRDRDPQEVGAVARRLRLDAVQLHGREEIAPYREALPEGVEIWAAQAMDRDGPQREGADRILFDTGSGGTGRTFDWSRLAGRAELRDGLLAGGLNPDNARKAARVGAWGLDVGSGLEAMPRWKDSNKMTAFFEALRPPARQDRASC